MRQAAHPAYTNKKQTHTNGAQGWFFLKTPFTSRPRDDMAEAADETCLRRTHDAESLPTLTKLDLKKHPCQSLPSDLHLCCKLQHLDIGGTPVKALDGIEKLPALRILFAKGCALGPVLPPGGPLTKCEALFMLGLGEAGLTELDGDAMPPNLHWLILPQNRISTVRNAARLGGVRKLMLSHNLLDAHAAAALIEGIPALEMLRVACNRLETIPDAAFAHPKLAWLAVGGNPYSERCTDAALGQAGGGGVPFLADAADVDVSDDELGRGSGAVVKRGLWGGQPVAVKLWCAERFSDGDARGEWLAGRLTGGCPHLVRTLAAWEKPSLGMALELLNGASAVSVPAHRSPYRRPCVDAVAGGRRREQTLCAHPAGGLRARFRRLRRGCARCGRLAALPTLAASHVTRSPMASTRG
jgi:hypothetical protein